MASMVGYKMIFYDFKSIWYHYQYEFNVIHSEIGIPIPQKRGFHFYRRIEDIPDYDEFFESGGYLLVKVEALGTIVSKVQKQPPNYEERYLYATNKIRIVQIITQTLSTQLYRYYKDDFIPKTFMNPDMVQENREYMEEAYNRLYNVIYKRPENEAHDMDGYLRKRYYPGILQFDGDWIAKGRREYGELLRVCIVGHRNDLTEEELDTRIEFKGLELEDYIPTEPGKNAKPLYITNQYDFEIKPDSSTGVYVYTLNDGDIYLIQSGNTVGHRFRAACNVDVDGTGEITIILTNLFCDNKGCEEPLFTFSENVTHVNMYVRSPTYVVVSGYVEKLVKAMNPSTTITFAAMTEEGMIEVGPETIDEGGRITTLLTYYNENEEPLDHLYDDKGDIIIEQQEND